MQLCISCMDPHRHKYFLPNDGFSVELLLFLMTHIHPTVIWQDLFFCLQFSIFHFCQIHPRLRFETSVRRLLRRNLLEFSPAIWNNLLRLCHLQEWFHPGGWVCLRSCNYLLPNQLIWLWALKYRDDNCSFVTRES